MAASTQVLPEDVVTATLYRTGQGVRLVDGPELARIFDEASKDSEGPYREFALHPRYDFSRVLSEALQVLDLGGSIRRENASQRYFSASPRTTGPYGKSKYERLTPAEQAAVDKVAAKLSQEFKSSNGLG
jgi:hypothetical protein